MQFRLLSAGRLTALAILASVVTALIVYISHRGRVIPTGPDSPKLQGRLVAVFNNSRYSHEVAGRVRFILTAGTDRSYEDGTHQLEQVRLESHGADGNRDDVVTADRANVSNTADLEKLDAEFISNVVVNTSDGLTLKSSYLRYNQGKNTIDTPEVVTFERKNMEGRSIGMLIETDSEKVHLLKEVEVTLKPEDEPGKASAAAGKPAPAVEETPEERAARKAAKRARKAERRQRLAQAAPQPRPDKSSNDPESSPKPRGAALGGKPKEPVHIKGDTALLEKKEHRVTFTGNVVVTKADEEMRSNTMVGFFDASNHFERIEGRGNSSLKQEGKSEVQSPDMDFFFGEGQRLVRSTAAGGVYAHSIGAEPLKEARSDSAEVTFVEGPQGNVADTLKADGNAIVHIHALTVPAGANPPLGAKNPTEREIRAASMLLKFFEDGRTIKSTDANGNAVMTVTPVRAEKGADKKTITAPHMNAEFWEQGNSVRTYSASGGVNVEFDATIPNSRPKRVTKSDRLNAVFQRDSNDVERIAQEGRFTYEEADRHGKADRAVYDGPADLLTLRGHRPEAWDAKSRTLAEEIDYDHGKDETHARGDVRTTYYNRDSAGDSTPFQKAKSPVFVTADRADARNGDGVAIYTGNAHGWQDDNFIKADEIQLFQDDKRMIATGHVDSALYKVERETSPGKREVVPAFASSQKMTYSDADRLVHYEGEVKARQGTDRIDASVMDVYLKSDSNEVDHMLAQGKVEMTQPGRHGVGDRLTYTSDDGRAVLTGKNARVDDDEKGSVMGAQLTFYNRDDKIFVDNQHGTGRVRSTHRLTKGKEKR
jgi:lipopolysaccharide transport protein LptA/LPS export ABC transporter protein LptC